MKQILFPGRFPLYVVVALWVFLGLGAGLWLVVGCLKYWGLAEDAADWVQAVGSVLAIVAAGALPLWHASIGEQREAIRISGTISLLAEDHEYFMRQLFVAFEASFKECDWGQSVTAYLQGEALLIWQIHVEALAAVNLAGLSAIQLRAVNDMKVASRDVLVLFTEVDRLNGLDEYTQRRKARFGKYFDQAIMIRQQVSLS